MTRTIFAYLDPGSSSMIIQMILGGFAAIGVALKLYWRRFKRFLHIGGREDEAEKQPAPVVSASANRATAPTTASANGTAAEREPVETTPNS